MDTQLEAVALALSVAKEILREGPDLYISLKGICIEYVHQKCEQNNTEVPESIKAIE